MIYKLLMTFKIYKIWLGEIHQFEKHQEIPANLVKMVDY